MATVKLQSSDEQEFSVPKAVAEMSVTIKNMLEGKKRQKKNSDEFC